MMRAFSTAALLGAMMLVVGCGGGNREAAKAPEANPWADYKGTYAAGAAAAPAESPAPADTKPVRTASAKPKPSTEAKPKTAANDARAMYGDAKSDDEPAPAAPRKPAAKKRGKAGAKKAPAKS